MSVCFCDLRVENIHKFINLTLYAPCIILQYVYKATRCTKSLVIRLYFLLILYGPCIILQYICNPKDTQYLMINCIHNIQ